MKFYTSPTVRVLLLFFVLLSMFSCSKDSDLFADYVIEDAISEIEQSENPEDPESDQTDSTNNSSTDQNNTGSNTENRTDGVNLSEYGAVGDGVTDDTAAIQAAFDNETNLVASSGKTFLISSTILIDQNQVNTIDFNGSTVTRNTTIHWMFNVEKRNFANSLTTIKNLILDGNNQGGSGIDIEARVHFENVEIKNFSYNTCLDGIRILVFDTPGIYGQSVFDNVDIHNLSASVNDGTIGNCPGLVTGFLVSAQATPSQEVQIVYKNSDLYEIWGEDSQGIFLNSPGRDTSNSPLSFWFENVNITDTQRRGVKNFLGNTTWVNCTFTSPASNNPNLTGTMAAAGLVAISSGSSATGSTNNLFCGCTFQGNPSDPYNSWYTEVLVVGQNGPAGATFRNSTFTGNHLPTNNNGFTAYTVPADGGTLADLIFTNCTFGTTKQIRVGSTHQPTGVFQLSTDNTYTDGKASVSAPTSASYTEPTIPFEACPSID